MLNIIVNNDAMPKCYDADRFEDSLRFLGIENILYCDTAPYQFAIYENGQRTTEYEYNVFMLIHFLYEEAMNPFSLGGLF